MSLVDEQVGSREGFDRTPPQDIAAEQSVLGGMLLSKDAIADVVEELRGNDFYRPAHEMVYEAILDLYGRGEPADAVTVAAELTKRGEIARVGGAPYLHTLISSVPTAANAGFYARIVREQAVLRRLVEAGTRIVQLGYSTDGGDVDELVNNAQAEVYAVTERRTSEDYVPLRDTINLTMEEIERAADRGEGMTGVPTGFTDLDALTNGLHGGQMIIIAARPAIGKALALDTPLPTPTGWTSMGEVQVGDELIAADGTPTRVVAATEVMVDRPCFEVTFDDGTTIVADAQHQWLTETRASRKSAQAAATGYNRYRNQRTFAEVRTTEEIARTLRCETVDRRLNHCVTNAKPLELPAAALPIDPYVLGVWLGDGHSAGARFTSADAEIPAFVRSAGYVVRAGAALNFSIGLPRDPEVPGRARPTMVAGRPATTTIAQASLAPHDRPARRGGWRCTHCGGPTSTASARLCMPCWRDRGNVQAQLRTLGVLGNKHIPSLYLRAGVSQRRALLAGLLDTDGTVNPTGSVQFAVRSRRLAEDFRELVHSLGYRTGWSEKTVHGRHAETSTAYTITFTTDDEVFRLARKQRAQRERRRSATPRRTSRFITRVRRVESVPVRCVQIDHPSHLYLASRAMIPTHNSTLALDICRSASIKNGQTSVIFSLEMGRTELTMRLLSAEAQVPLQNMRKGTMREEDWTRMATAMSRVSEAPLFIDDSPNMSLMEIRAKCRRLKQKHDLKLVVVDYLQLMTSGKRVESRQQEVSEFSRALKLLAKEVEVPVIAVAQLNRGPEQRTDKKPMMSDLRESGCLTADTRVMRADTGAEVTMGELFLSGGKDLPVWALDDRLKYVRRHITSVFSTGVKPVFRMKLASGREITATGNHPFLTYTGWTALEELQVGSRIGVPRHVPAPDHEADWDDRKVVMLAHLLGDGSFVRRQPIRYASIDEQNLAAVQDAATVFGITPVRDDYAAARCATLRLPAPHRLTHGKSHPIAEWLDGFGLFGMRSHEKFIPDEVFHLPKRQIALFLRHLWATDGSIVLHPNGRAGRVYYATTSRRLADGVANLLLRFGIDARISSATKPGYPPGYAVDVSGLEEKRVFLERIGVHGERGRTAAVLLERIRDIKANTNVDTVPLEVWHDVRRVLTEQGMTHRAFQAALGTQYCGSTLFTTAPSRERLGRIAAVLESDDLEMMAVNDLLWDRIVSIEPVGEEKVFDATVAGSHNFIANGIAVHNSLEQDADVVMLLHREDAYEKESPRAGEADIIVAKHRNGPTDTVTVAFQGHYSRFVDMAR
ncbi:replicative DNA helicase [Georgenia sp. AZ-5]|uniref:replicative DNA helicase n=1 Tax=Georgenia sp. AZ-5 TaxID=3367526 RepID=UPI003754B3F3